MWDVERARPATAIRCHSDVLYSAAWNHDGSLLATTCRDRILRIIDPRSGTCVEQFECHDSPKSSRCVFIDDHTVLTTGVSRSSDREFALWNTVCFLNCSKFSVNCFLTFPFSLLQNFRPSKAFLMHGFRSPYSSIFLKRLPLFIAVISIQFRGDFFSENYP